MSWLVSCIFFLIGALKAFGSKRMSSVNKEIKTIFRNQDYYYVLQHVQKFLTAIFFKCKGLLKIGQNLDSSWLASWAFDLVHNTIRQNIRPGLCFRKMSVIVFSGFSKDLHVKNQTNCSIMCHFFLMSPHCYCMNTVVLPQLPSWLFSFHFIMLQPDATPPPVTKGVCIICEAMMSPHSCLRLRCSGPGQAEETGGKCIF